MPHTLPKGKGVSMKPLVTTCFVIFLGITLVACDQSIPTNPTTSDSNVQGEIADTFTTPAVKASVASGEYRNRVHLPPPLVTTTDTSSEGDSTMEDSDTSSHDVGEEVDLGPPLPEDIPPPELEKLDPALCKKMVEVTKNLKGEGEWWPPNWHHPACDGSATPVTRLSEISTLSVNISTGQEPAEETTETCAGDGISWYEKHACMAPYQELLFPLIKANLPEGSEWKAVLAHEYAKTNPKSSQELHDVLVESLKLKELLPLFTQGASVTLSTFSSYGKGLRAQVVITHPALGTWTGTLLVPMGKIRGVVLAIHGHEVHGFMGPNGLMKWLKGFGMDSYPEDGIAVLLMASRPYMGIGYQGVESFEPKLAYDLWGMASIPLASILVIEHLLELEMLRHLQWTDQNGETQTTAGVPIAYIGHSGGGSIAQVLSMASPPTAGVIVDYTYSPTGTWPFFVPGAGRDAPHCETIRGAGNGGPHEAMNGEHSLLDYQILFASDEQYYFHYELLPDGNYLPPWELEVRRQVLMTMLGIIQMPVIPPPGG